ncbi:general stress protein [Humibacter albus]|uniref:general stress protein n=1 Tax=Humibacter albus TaxID=427754 RepID=UPI00040B52D7|nr:general stress protein [Humibacter albus]
MSSQSPFGGRQRQVMPTVPRGEVVATFETYLDAQGAVDVLARADFPVAQVSIVGSDLKTVERVTGKLTWGRVAAAGAASGIWLGIFFGLLLMIFNPTMSYGVLLAALLLGAGFGMLFGLVSYAITRRRRDYTSMTQVLATSYSIVVDPDLANRARNLLGNEGAGVHDAGASFVPPQRHPSEPPPAMPPAQNPPTQNPPTQPGDGGAGANGDVGENGDPSRAPGGQEPPRYGERTSQAAPPRYGERTAQPVEPPRYGQRAPQPPTDE